MEISFHSHLDSNTVIATKFCTWHDSCAVVTFAEICCDLMASNGIMASLSFHRIWMAGKKTLVKRTPGVMAGTVAGKHMYELLALCAGNPPVIVSRSAYRYVCCYWPFVQGIHQSQWIGVQGNTCMTLLALCTGNPPVTVDWGAGKHMHDITGPLYRESTWQSQWIGVQGNTCMTLLALCTGNPRGSHSGLGCRETHAWHYWPVVQGNHKSQWLECREIHVWCY